MTLKALASNTFFRFVIYHPSHPDEILAFIII
ncbi:hypothetical protein ES703_20177 [subsurface metagenome]